MDVVVVVVVVVVVSLLQRLCQLSTAVASG